MYALPLPRVYAIFLFAIELSAKAQHTTIGPRAPGVPPPYPWKAGSRMVCRNTCTPKKACLHSQCANGIAEKFKKLEKPQEVLEAQQMNSNAHQYVNVESLLVLRPQLAMPPQYTEVHL